MLIVILLFVIISIYWLLKQYQLLLMGLRIDGPWALPIIGNIQLMTRVHPKYILKLFTEYRLKYRKVFRFWIGPKLWVFLHTPEEARQALNDATLIKPQTFNQLSLFIGNGLLINNGHLWEHHRRIINPAFSTRILHSFTISIAEHSELLAKKLHNMQGQSVEIDEYIFPAILDIIVDTSMGKNLNAQSDPHSVYTHVFHRLSELLFERMMNPLLANDFIYKCTSSYKELTKLINFIHKTMTEILEERCKFLQMGTDNKIDNDKSTETLNANLNDVYVMGKGQTLLDTLLTANIDGKALTVQEIFDEINTFVFAGVDTTTAAMGFILYAIGKYPDEQDRLVNEIHDVFESGTSTFSVSNLNCLEYLDMFIKECLRFYTIVPVTGRQTVIRTTIGEHSYCPNVTLWINLYGLAHDEEYFPQPHEFQPERFHRSSSRHLHAYSYLPYSGGPHVCIGRKYSLLIMKILIVTILQNFHIRLTHPNEELQLMAQMVLKTANGIHLRFQQR